MDHRDVALQRIAARQHNVFTRAQALSVGISDRGIKRRLDAEIWTKLHPGVYIAAGVPVTWKQQLAGALLACGPTARASHRAAATVWRLAEDLFASEVTTDADVRRAPRGVLVHRSHRAEVAMQDSFRVTRPARTILDLAASLDEERLARVVDSAHRRGLIVPRRLASYMDEPPNRNAQGSRVLREILVACTDDANASELESMFFTALRRSALPLPVAQHPVRTRRGLKYVDYAYPERMIAIELDSWEFHGSRLAFEADRARRNELELLGWHVLHFTWKELKNDPIGVAVSVATALGLRPTRWRPS